MTNHWHHPIIFLIMAVVAAVCAFGGFVWGKSKGHSLEGSTLGIWLGGAMSAFIGGYVEASPVGTTAGAGLAAVSGHVHADLTFKHIIIEIMFLVATPFGAGVAEIRTFIKTNPFPNVFLPDSPPSIAASPPKLATPAPSAPTAVSPPA